MEDEDEREEIDGGINNDYCEGAVDNTSMEGLDGNAEEEYRNRETDEHCQYSVEDLTKPMASSSMSDAQERTCNMLQRS